MKQEKYWTVRHAQNLDHNEEDTSLKQGIKVMSVLTGKTVEEIRSLPMKDYKALAGKAAEYKQLEPEFHSILEYKGELLGYAHVKQMTFGEFLELEGLVKNAKENYHSIAALLYRPIKKHKFDTFKFQYKAGIKALDNEVENIFDQYRLEKYDSEERWEREESFRDFPLHVILGAVSFFLTCSIQYLLTTPYLDQLKKTEKIAMTLQAKSLLANIGGGGLLYTHSPSPIYYQYPGTKQ